MIIPINNLTRRKEKMMNGITLGLYLDGQAPSNVTSYFGTMGITKFRNIITCIMFKLQKFQDLKRIVVETCMKLRQKKLGIYEISAQPSSAQQSSVSSAEYINGKALHFYFKEDIDPFTTEPRTIFLLLENDNLGIIN